MRGVSRSKRSRSGKSAPAAPGNRLSTLYSRSWPRPWRAGEQARLYPRTSSPRRCQHQRHRATTPPSIRPRRPILPPPDTAPAPEVVAVDEDSRAHRYDQAMQRMRAERAAEQKRRADLHTFLGIEDDGSDWLPHLPAREAVARNRALRGRRVVLTPSCQHPHNPGKYVMAVHPRWQEGYV